MGVFRGVYGFKPPDDFLLLMKPKLCENLIGLSQFRPESYLLQVLACFMATVA